MRVVAKIERMKGEDFYNDDWNIADMEKKEEMVKVTLPFWENVQTPAMDGRGRPTERRDGDAEHLFSPS